MRRNFGVHGIGSSPGRPRLRSWRCRSGPSGGRFRAAPPVARGRAVNAKLAAAAAIVIPVEVTSSTSWARLSAVYCLRISRRSLARRPASMWARPSGYIGAAPKLLFSALVLGCYGAIVARVTKKARPPRKRKAVDDIPAMPGVDDFRLLGELDEFNKHVKAGIRHLLERGYHRLFVKWMVKQHLSFAGAQVLADHATLVDLVTMNVDMRTKGSKRRELIDALVEAGALSGDGGNEKRHKRLRDRLSNARKWRRQRDASLIGDEEAPEYENPFDDPSYVDWAIESVIDDLGGYVLTQSVARRLGVIGALGGRKDGPYEGLREQSLDEVLKGVGEELVFLETAKVSRADRARIKAAIRELDAVALEKVQRAQDNYIASLDDGAVDEDDDD
jgi:hypothetical protein